MAVAGLDKVTTPRLWITSHWLLVSFFDLVESCQWILVCMKACRLKTAGMRDPGESEIVAPGVVDALGDGQLGPAAALQLQGSETDTICISALDG
jgi:hypothetical protein